MIRKLTLFALIAALTLFPPAVEAQTTVPVTASWDAPTTGSPVVVYVLQVSTDGGSTWQTASAQIEETSYVVELEILVPHVARVAGIDALDRQGPWSDTSDEYTPDPGPPGQPGGCQWIVGR